MLSVKKVVLQRVVFFFLSDVCELWKFIWKLAFLLRVSSDDVSVPRCAPIRVARTPNIRMCQKR